ncbi:hypothetical protein niasHT_027469 [Heterodera trifolii]|uniref:Fido domain-containing protein n=1 Tax=Heterodera trifolii TaxID=157864 RepID=A0ABD2JMK9_9BILA
MLLILAHIFRLHRLALGAHHRWAGKFRRVNVQVGDFMIPLIIHPHRDANGRVSRLFANLLLMRRGLNTISYLPAVPAQESQYYDALVAASTHNNPMPFINFVSAMIQNHNW